MRGVRRHEAEAERITPMHVPNASMATVADEKLSDYLLSETHPVGRFKAAFFRSLGYTLNTANELEVDLLALLENEVTETVTSDYGTKYVVPGVLGRGDYDDRLIVSVWIILAGEKAPRFVTAYPRDEADD